MSVDVDIAAQAEGSDFVSRVIPAGPTSAHRYLPMHGTGPRG
jgi:hypothetical protein